MRLGYELAKFPSRLTQKISRIKDKQNSLCSFNSLTPIAIIFYIMSYRTIPNLLFVLVFCVTTAIIFATVIATKRIFSLSAHAWSAHR